MLVLATATAHAQPAPSAEADTLFDQGRTLLSQGKFAEACSTFDASQKLAPAVTTVFNQADCREKNKQLATAYGLWRDAERQTRAPLDDGTQKLNRLALDRAKALEPRLSKLAIDMAPANRVAGLQLLRNGEAIDAVAIGRPLPVDGGTYTIVARGPDHQDWTGTIDVGAEGDFKTLTVPKLIAKPRPVARRTPSSKLVPLAIGGGAVLLLGGALGLELSARGTYGDAKDEPDDLRQESQWQSAKSRRYLAQGFAVAGIGAAGVAVWLYLRDRRTETRPTGVAVEPAVGAGVAGLQVRGGF